jgi:hypothetical protein
MESQPCPKTKTFAFRSPAEKRQSSSGWPRASAISLLTSQAKGSTFRTSKRCAATPDAEKITAEGPTADFGLDNASFHNINAHASNVVYRQDFLEKAVVLFEMLSGKVVPVQLNLSDMRALGDCRLADAKKLAAPTVAKHGCELHQQRNDQRRELPVTVAFYARTSGSRRASVRSSRIARAWVLRCRAAVSGRWHSSHTQCEALATIRAVQSGGPMDVTGASRW